MSLLRRSKNEGISRKSWDFGFFGRSPEGKQASLTLYDWTGLPPKYKVSSPHHAELNPFWYPLII
jgi:hypothetical protein